MRWILTFLPNESSPPVAKIAWNIRVKPKRYISNLFFSNVASPPSHTPISGWNLNDIWESNIKEVNLICFHKLSKPNYPTGPETCVFFLQKFTSPTLPQSQRLSAGMARSIGDWERGEKSYFWPNHIVFTDIWPTRIMFCNIKLVNLWPFFL